ncbi:haloacid dehalogenase type II [Cytobacillus sp. S13-E01]|uniref:haloacid dehalogenase type II n=1 Tax=Cytobacillus sp. S13-E01 TaxID=3031326 RepID=UPI0023D8345C|nr:haloacid dehalogenase type II [Cytobacillus sp. S13-E01]MDF0728220.1 haloacid dehalogenase type II [Cytobacillus sp. S13-E01]
MNTIKAFVFDAYGTLFDVNSVAKACEELFPQNGSKICKVWREKQLEYSFLRQLMGRYIPFSAITRDALQYACAREGVVLTEEKEIFLLDKYLHLKSFPEVKEVLKAIKERNRIIFSNGSYDMLLPLVNNSWLEEFLDDVISVDEVKEYKPTPMSYQIIIERLGVKRNEVLFMSSNTWDIAGATSFGFYTAWINRKNDVMDNLGVAPNFIYSDLTGILEHS